MVSRMGLRSDAFVRFEHDVHATGHAARWLAPALISLSAGLTPALALGADADVKVSTVGYVPERAKVGTVTGEVGSTFALKRAGDGTTVLAGELGTPRVDATTEESFRLADFSTVREPGTYYLDVPSVGRSVDFAIGADVFARRLEVVMLGFYGWRSGVAVEFTHQGQTFRHGPGHLQDGLLDYLGQPGVERDGSRGWYDAGDYGKYTVNSALTLGTLLQAWESFRPGLEALELMIPERDGPLPDFLAELKWQFDWLLTMQYSETDGRVSHKLSSLQFAGFVMPEDDVAPTYYSPFGSAATAAFAATMAKGARVYAEQAPALAERMLAAARLSWTWLADNPGNVRADISAFKTGGYQSVDDDDRAWAAAELWQTTGEAHFLEEFESRLRAFEVGVELEFDWPNLKNLGVYTYLLSTREGRDPALVERLRSELLERADELVATHAESGYGRAITSHYWGINGVVARTCMSLQVAHRLAPNARYLDVCADQVAHLYGRNTFGRSYITGDGKDPPRYPHHRPSGADGIEAPFPGLLIGGPQPSPTDWDDNEENYTTNEVAINWNAALVFALAGFLVPEPVGGAGSGGTGGAGASGSAGAGESGGAGGNPNGGSGGIPVGAGGAPGSGGAPGVSGAPSSGGAPSGTNAGSSPIPPGAAPAQADDDGGGCGCRVGSAPGPVGAAWGLAALAATAARVRRRRAHRENVKNVTGDATPPMAR